MNDPALGTYNISKGGGGVGGGDINATLHDKVYISVVFLTSKQCASTPTVAEPGA